MQVDGEEEEEELPDELENGCSNDGKSICVPESSRPARSCQFILFSLDDSDSSSISGTMYTSSLALLPG